MLGAHVGGPGGRRQKEVGHTPLDYMRFIDLIESMLEYDPKFRITAGQALSHPFFSRSDELDLFGSTIGKNSISGIQTLGGAISKTANGKFI